MPLQVQENQRNQRSSKRKMRDADDARGWLGGGLCDELVRAKAQLKRSANFEVPRCRSADRPTITHLVWLADQQRLPCILLSSSLLCSQSTTSMASFCSAEIEAPSKDLEVKWGPVTVVDIASRSPSPEPRSRRVTARISTGRIRPLEWKEVELKNQQCEWEIRERISGNFVRTLDLLVCSKRVSRMTLAADGSAA